jgi:hypothetical protein
MAQFRPPEYGGRNDAEPAEALGADGAPSAAEEARGPGRGQKDPIECADRVLRAVREGRFYVFTHPENRTTIKRRFEQRPS